MDHRPAEESTRAQVEEDILPEEDIEVDDEEIDSLDDVMFDPMQQFTQLLVTESGVPLVDVLQGIQEAIEKQNKIMYKLVSVVESKTCGKA